MVKNRRGRDAAQGVATRPLLPRRGLCDFCHFQFFSTQITKPITIKTQINTIASIPDYSNRLISCFTRRISDSPKYPKYQKPRKVFGSNQQKYLSRTHLDYDKMKTKMSRFGEETAKIQAFLLFLLLSNFSLTFLIFENK